MSAAEPLRPHAISGTEAQAKLKQMTDLAFARGVKQGRQDERRDVLAKAGLQTLDDLSMLAAVRAEHKQEMDATELRWHREEAKAKAGAFWRGAAAGALGTTIVLCASFLVIFNSLVATLSREARETANAGVLVGAAARSAGVQEPVTEPEGQ